jgi:type II secretory pathway pseudopilin PulG
MKACGRVPDSMRRDNLSDKDSSRLRTGSTESGVSIVEVAIIGMIIAIVIAFALPSISNSIRNYNLRSAAERIAERISGGRALAMNKNKAVTISFDTTGQYGYDFYPVGAPDGTPDSVDPEDPTQSYYTETPPSGISITSITGAQDLTNGKGVTYTSRGELPIGAGQVDIVLSNGSSTTTVSINLRGQVWVH